VAAEDGDHDRTEQQMAERDGYIPGVPCWVDTNQPDPKAAVTFYASLFGWELEDVMPPESPSRYFIGRIRGGDVAAIGSIPEAAPPVAAWNTYVWVESADDTAAKVARAGGTGLMAPFDVSDAGRMGVFADPEGAVFSVWEARRHKGATVVNEAGSLNFNGLNTRDPDRAKAFYGDVFGWETMPVGRSVEMWTLPGYGDYLERDRPSLRQEMAEMGVSGFEDVVASLNVIGADQPPHWSVTFAVDDADTVAERTSQLGGKVLVPPFDAPWVRTTVLADPQGATFIATKFSPENRDVPEPQSSARAA
jgi:predicted enzyme related to lactoylglutathione lyase